MNWIRQTEKIEENPETEPNVARYKDATGAHLNISCRMQLSVHSVDSSMLLPLK